VGAAEKLFTAAADVAGVDANTTVLDVCCGTGTIGLCLAGKCKEVLGVDIVEDAIADAKANAERNGVTNTTYEAGPAEYVLKDQLRRARGSKAVAVVDPPRAGLHFKAIQALRASSVDTLVYVSCDAKAAMGNFTALSKASSKTLPGDPFLPRQVLPVDLFPHTRHYELVILFERVSMMKLLGKEEVS